MDSPFYTAYMSGYVEINSAIDQAISDSAKLMTLCELKQLFSIIKKDCKSLEPFGDSQSIKPPNKS